MSTTAIQTTPPPTTAFPAARLLGAAAAAAPLFATSVLVQAATRDGYDITRHPASMLANGDLGWVQIATFLTAGLLMLAGAVGLRTVLRQGPGRVWGPRLLTAEGVGLLIAGVCRLDPADGFPPGTPTGTPATMSWHSVAHNLAGTVVFLAMIATCFVLARRFTGPWRTIGYVCGATFSIGLVWCYTGGAGGALILFLGVVTGWSWICATAAHLARTAARNPERS
jgi:hypothetical protein